MFKSTPHVPEPLLNFLPPAVAIRGERDGPSSCVDDQANAAPLDLGFKGPPALGTKVYARRRVYLERCLLAGCERDDFEGAVLHLDGDRTTAGRLDLDA